MSFEQTTRFGEEPPRAPQGSWFSRNWVWLLLSGIVGSCCLCGGGVGGIVMLGVSVLKGSEPYQMALDRVRNDPEVQEAIGQPIEEASFMPMGNFEQKNSSGKAEFQFDVSGPKGKAHVQTRAVMDDGKWTTTELEVDVVGGKKFTLE